MGGTTGHCRMMKTENNVRIWWPVGGKDFLYINNSQVDVTFFLPLYGYYTVITIPYAWVDFPLTAGRQRGSFQNENVSRDPKIRGRKELTKFLTEHNKIKYAYVMASMTVRMHFLTLYFRKHESSMTRTVQVHVLYVRHNGYPK